MTQIIRRAILALALIAGITPVLAQAPAPVPALPDSERRTSYVISGSVCSCAVNMQLYGDSTDVANWIKVYINGVEIPQSGNWNITSPSGSIATLPRPITNAVLTFTTAQTGTVQIVGAQRPRRLSEYAENRGVAARDLNQAINGIEAQLREMWDRQFRTVQAVPGETLNMLPPLASRANMGACFDSGGNLAPCVAASGSFIAGTGIGLTGTNPTTISYTGATYSAGSGIQFTGTNPTVISTTPSISIPLISTRSAAAAQDLSAYTVIKTAGYATAGDGGGATFKKVAVAFRDSYVVTPTITGNGTSGCTNGTYRNKQPTGGTGTNLILTLTVSGAVVTGVALAGTGGNGYTNNDIVTTTVTGCATSVTINVGTVSTPSGSFTDSAGNKWQITPDEGNFTNVRQFGAKVDYAGTDASATNDYQAIQNAYSYCADIHSPTIDGGGSAGCKVIHPAGNSLVCGSVPLEVPQGVAVEGANMWASTLKMCAAWTSGVTFMNICNPNTQVSCFATYIRNLTFYSPFAQASSANSSMIYSNNIQQVDVFDRVAIYSGQRECIRLETGFGGAALLGMQNVECTPGATSTNAGIFINYGTTLVSMRNVHVETSGATLSGLKITGGFVNLTGFHTEGISTGVEVNITGSTSNGIVQLFLLSGGVSCTNLVLRSGIANALVVGNAVPNGCTNTVNNSGVLTTTPVVANTLY